jgi:hypothetical protein
MDLKKALAVLGMVAISWLLVIGTIYGALQLYRIF